jgi:pimeloyl-ACP methyl ester carboxylesterase
MTSRLVAAIERGARFVLNRRGFVSRTVDTTAGPLHVYDGRGRGDLPTAVVLHGLGSAASAFAPVLDRLLSHSRRVVAPDLPGHGFSAAPAVTLTAERLVEAVGELLDGLGEPIFLVGTSLGGGLALRYAARRPQVVSALALISPAGAQLEEGEWDELVRAFDPARARALLDRLYHRVPWYASALAPSVRALMSRSAVRDILASATPADLPPPESLRNLPMPVLLLWGESERLFPASALAYFRANLPAHAIIEQPAGFGHCPHLEQPARLAARLVAFAQSARADRTV